MFGLEKLFGNKTDYKDLMQKGAVIIDVREPAEYVMGHIKGSKNISMGKLQGLTNELKKMNKPIITVCKSGARSAMSTRILKAAGVDAYNGGSWVSLKKEIQ